MFCCKGLFLGFRYRLLWNFFINCLYIFSLYVDVIGCVRGYGSVLDGCENGLFECFYWLWVVYGIIWRLWEKRF